MAWSRAAPSNRKPRSLPAPFTTTSSAAVEIVGGINRNLGLAITNPTGSANSITVTLKDDTGSSQGVAVLSIAPYKQVSRFVSELFPADVIGASFIGSVSVQSATPFAPLALTFTAGTFSTVTLSNTTANATIPTRSLTAGAQPDTPTPGTVGGTGSIIFPQFAAGGGWATEISLVNAGTNAITGRIDLFNPDGSPVPLKLNGALKSTFTYSIPAGETLILAPRDLNGQSPL
jgi:hypothetical protein